MSENSEEFPILSPEGMGRGQRFESSNMDIEAVRLYLEDTKFEDGHSLIDFLSKQEDMQRRIDALDMKVNMTRIFKGFSKEDVIKMRRGERPDVDLGVPLSGIEPEIVLNKIIQTRDGMKYDLKIFEIQNRNQVHRFEYVLEPVK